MTEILSCRNVCDIPNEICLRKSQIAGFVLKVANLERISLDDPTTEELALEAKTLQDSDCMLLELSKQLGELEA